MSKRQVHNVIWQPNGGDIGKAATEAGAKRCAARILLSPRERLSATLADRLIDTGETTYFEKTWFVSPVLKVGKS